jgi:protein-tyrosine-phosphatase
MYSVLFVCTANICRSPMAEGLLKGMVADEADQWRIASAGIWALVGQPAALHTRQVLQQRGLALPDFRSRSINKALMDEFNLILTMERGHKEALRAAFPEYAGKVRLLNELVGRSGDILDPVGGPVEDFEDTAQELETLLKSGYDQLRRLAADAPPTGSGKGTQPASQ